MAVGSETKSRPRGGCLKGCLITILVLFLFSTAIIIGGYFAGKRYIEANLPAWKAEYPILGAVTGLLSFDKDDPFEISRQEKRYRVEGSGDWGDVPAEIPVFDNAVKGSVSISETSVTIYQEIPGSLPQVYRQAMERFQSRGWKHESSGKEAAIFSKPGWTCSVKVTDPLGLLFQPVQIAEVWVSCVKETEGVGHE